MSIFMTMAVFLRPKYEGDRTFEPIEGISYEKLLIWV